VLLSATLSGAANAQVRIVALGASNTYGKTVARNQAYPAQLQGMLKARGISATVVNAGINGDTTAGMLARLGSAVPNGTQLVILQPGGNDRRRGDGDSTAGNVAQIRSRLAARGIKVVMMANSMFRAIPQSEHHPDGQHFTAKGYQMLAANILPQVVAAVGR
jgi:acyl-CoA thioesterase-1